MFGRPILHDSTYLRLDASNGPLTGTLDAQIILPSDNAVYDLGAASFAWRDIWAARAKIVQRIGTGTAVFVGSLSSLVGCTVLTANATAAATIDIDSDNAGIAYCAGAAAWAAGAGDVATIEILGPSGINFGSAITLLGTPPNTARITFAAVSSGSVNFGSAIQNVAATGDCIIDISGDGVTNFGSSFGTGGTITLSGNTCVNLGTLIGGTLTISGASSFNLGTCESAGTINISGIGSYNLAHVSVGTLTLSGNDAINLGSIDGTGSTIAIAGNNVQNFMAVNTGADVSISAGVDGAYARGLATGSAVITISADGASVQGLFLGRAVTPVLASGVGASIIASVDLSGAASTPGTCTVTSSGPGSIVIGSVTAQTGGTGVATFRATGGGAIAMGHVQLVSTAAATLESLGTGSFAGGICFSGILRASSGGSFVWGYVNGSTAQLTAAGNGAFSHGRVDGTGSIISCAGNGAFSGGYAVSGGQVASAGSGSFAHGYSPTSPFYLFASANGSMVVGDATSGIIAASAINAFQLGVGTNDVTTSFQVGNAASSTGVWLVRSGLPGATPIDGQIWKTVTTNRLSIRSAGQTLNLYRQSAYNQTAYATVTTIVTARTAATITGSAGGTGDTAMVAVADPADAPATADALRDDLVANVLPTIRDDLDDLRVQLNALKVDADNSAQVLNNLLDDLQVVNLVA